MEIVKFIETTKDFVAAPIQLPDKFNLTREYEAAKLRYMIKVRDWFLEYYGVTLDEFASQSREGYIANCRSLLAYFFKFMSPIGITESEMPTVLLRGRSNLYNSIHKAAPAILQDPISKRVFFGLASEITKHYEVPKELKN